MTVDCRRRWTGAAAGGLGDEIRHRAGIFPPAPFDPDPIIHYSQAADGSDSNRSGFPSTSRFRIITVALSIPCRGQIARRRRGHELARAADVPDLRRRRDQKDPARHHRHHPAPAPSFIHRQGDGNARRALQAGARTWASAADGSRRSSRRWDSTSTSAANAPTSRSRQSGRCGATTRRVFPASISNLARSRAFPNRCTQRDPDLRRRQLARRDPPGRALRQRLYPGRRGDESKPISTKSRRNARGSAAIRLKSNYAADANRPPTRSSVARTWASPG